VEPPAESFDAEEIVVDESVLESLPADGPAESDSTQKSIPWIPFASAVVVLVFLAAGGWFLLRKSKPSKPKQTPSTKASDNLIETNPSFEQDVTPDGKVPGWLFRSDPGSKWALDTTAGRGTSLQVTRLGEAESSATDQAVYAKRIPIMGASAFTVSAWVKSNSSSGVHTLRLSWFSETDPVFQEDLFAPPATGKCGWRQVRLVARPPGRATHLQVACVTVGATRSVWFDDVEVIPGAAGGKGVQDTWKTFRNISLALGPQGTFRLHKGGALFLWNGELQIETVQSDVGLRQRLARPAEGYPQPEAGGEGIAFKGTMFEPSTLMRAQFEEVARPAADGLEVVYKVSAPQALKMQTFTLSFVAHAANLTSGVTVGIDGTYQTERESFATPSATELAIGDGPKRTHFAFSVPVKILCKQRDEKYVFRIAPDVDMRQTRTELSLGVVIRPASAQQKEMVERLLARAARAAEQQQFGEALKTYQKILEDQTLPQEMRKKAFSALTRMRLNANMMLKDVRSNVDDALQSANPAKLTAAHASCKDALQKLQGTALADEAAALLKRLEKAKTPKPEATADSPEAQKFYKKALDHYERKSFLMAKILCNNVINRFPDTASAEKAKRLLEQIKGAEAARVEAERQAKRKLSQAKNLVTVNKLQEAAKLYNEIVKDYPNLPAAEEARKGLRAIAEKMAQP